ncbi:uncharacterized protein EI97DRAFT_459404 [Westerdykella ornata]|uniref:Uncharacterized protein n=1 Tax=Westerdykella ornata TaxID=318751 RepID=A0A6A6JH29_WESOR|nr:uncharacterized protein EI97DRAFT_459404 [Westerdykella ornata]KAF2275504.1 hypothetical protein EI97DRAFT_459404 [Westerdykella ornata]
MDFFARVNERLLQPVKPKSHLRPYFEAHLLFQDTYHSPPTSPESSPEPDERAVRPNPAFRKKRKHESDDEGYTSGQPNKRRRTGLALGISTVPTPPTVEDSAPASPTRLRRVETQDSAYHEDEVQQETRTNVGPSPPMSPEAEYQPRKWARNVTPCAFANQECERATGNLASMKIGKYSLRWTAARARQADG